MSSVLLLGADGMLGRTFRERFAQTGTPFTPITRAELDVTAHDALAGVLGDARTVINCTAYTDVDGAETNEALAHAINADAVAALAAHTRKTGALLVSFSTDYVFDGAATTPYRADGRRAPLNAYGRSKAKGEEALEASGAQFLNIRTSWLYAPWAKNFVRTIAAASQTRPSLRVVSDQRGRPTSTRTLARVSLELVEKGARGHYHVTDGGECTWFELAAAVAARVSPTCVVEPCSSAEFPRPAARPTYSVLDLAETERLLGRTLPHYTTALDDVLASLTP